MHFGLQAPFNLLSKWDTIKCQIYWKVFEGHLVDILLKKIMMYSFAVKLAV